MKKRESFNSRWGFILACIGSAVGMVILCQEKVQIKNDFFPSCQHT